MSSWSFVVLLSFIFLLLLCFLFAFFLVNMSVVVLDMILGAATA